MGSKVHLLTLGSRINCISSCGNDVTSGTQSACSKAFFRQVNDLREQGLASAQKEERGSSGPNTALNHIQVRGGEHPISGERGDAREEPSISYNYTPQSGARQLEQMTGVLKGSIFSITGTSTI